jgi:RNA polymerase sigma-70 factor (ECF subfamily)
VDDGKTAPWCERLYHAKATELILYGRALGLSHAEAEDVLQETFVRLLAIDDAPEKPEHYCVRCFRNNALNHRRSLWRRVTREFESARWFDRSSDESPHERAAMRCLAELPVTQREVIVLKLWHDCTFEEIGELLDVSPNTAAGRYRYGLEKLRACIKGEHYETNGQSGETVAFLDAAPPVAGT